ncbi:MAG: hypothetical protein AB7M12_01810 [Hyphomonadaceae bacterium]
MRATASDQTVRHALMLCLVVAAAAAVRPIADLATTLGDTDDAMRLVEARALLNGRPWFDLMEPRLAPPLGLAVHWSRFVDAPIAVLLSFFSALFGPATGESVMRAAWPLLVFAPTAYFWIRASAKLGAPSAPWFTAAAAPLCWLLWDQFTPGRLDHHNVQLLVMAALMWLSLDARRPLAAAWMGGLAAFAMAIGYEALPVIAWAGGLIGVRLILSRENAPAAQAFGLAFAGVTGAAFLAQTPPAWWARSACDALAFNGLAGGIAGGLALAAAGRWAPADWRARMACVALGGAAAAGVFIGMHPSCLRGPYGDLDPRLLSIWLDRVGEARPLWQALRAQPLMALSVSALPLASLAAATVMVARGTRRDAGFVGLAALLALTALVSLLQTRGFTMATAAALPLAAAMLSAAPQVSRLRPMLAGLVLGFAASPTALLIALTAATPATVHAREERAVRLQAPCFADTAFADLKRLPKGVVFADLDAGPFILALTPHAAASAPYHRLNGPIYDAMTAFYAPPAEAAKAVRRAGADYVALCKSGVFASEAKPGTFGHALKHGAAPEWAEPLPSASGNYLLFRVNRAALPAG